MPKKKFTEYLIVDYPALQGLQIEINKHSKNGFEIHGNIQIDKKGTGYFVVMKRLYTPEEAD